MGNIFQVKQSLKEAVEMNEQQLQMTEQKDQEFVKLKLEIQQTIADKDKTIKEQKQKLKSKYTYIALDKMPSHFDPFKPHFYILNLGFSGV